MLFPVTPSYSAMDDVQIRLKTFASAIGRIELQISSESEATVNSRAADRAALNVPKMLMICDADSDEKVPFAPALGAGDMQARAAGGALPAEKPYQPPALAGGTSLEDTLQSGT